jgi:hypothetical protein
MTPSTSPLQALTETYESGVCGIAIHYPSDWKVNDFALSTGNPTRCSRLLDFPGSPPSSCGDQPLKHQTSLVEVFHGDRPIGGNGAAPDVHLFALGCGGSDADAVIAAQTKFVQEIGFREVRAVHGRVSSQAAKCLETLAEDDSGRAPVRSRTCFLHVGTHLLGVGASSFDTDWPRESATMFAIMDAMQLTPATP